MKKLSLIIVIFHTRQLHEDARHISAILDGFRPFTADSHTKSNFSTIACISRRQNQFSTIAYLDYCILFSHTVCSSQLPPTFLDILLSSVACHNYVNKNVLWHNMQYACNQCTYVKTLQELVARVYSQLIFVCTKIQRNGWLSPYITNKIRVGCCSHVSAPNY